MKKLMLLFLSLIFSTILCDRIPVKPDQSIHAVLSQIYSTKIFARGQVQLQGVNSKESYHIYYDGTSRKVDVEDGHFTIEINNPDKLNILIAHSDNISMKGEDEKNKLAALQVTNEFQFFALEKESLDNAENKSMVSWKIKKDAALKKDADGNYTIPPNTLIIPIYNKDFNVQLSSTCWKAEYNSNCLPTIAIQGKEEDLNTAVRKACWLHLKIGQLHPEQKTKRYKEDNKEISFN